MTSFDIQKWNRALEIAEENNLNIKVKDSFYIERKGYILGSFHRVDEVFAYVCGYQCASEKTITEKSD